MRPLSQAFTMSRVPALQPMDDDLIVRTEGFRDMLDRTHNPVGPSHALDCPMV